jgi:acetylornithine deacetylase/succinyl-diaminopimelate desuccinylase-like protein
VAYAESQQETPADITPPPVPTVIATAASTRPDETGRYVDETIKVRAMSKQVVIGNTEIKPAPPTHTAKTPSELQHLLSQKHPYRIMIRVAGKNEHSSRASKEGNGIYNAYMVASELQTSIKDVASKGGHYGIHVLNGANNITPADVVLVIDCPDESTFEHVQKEYRQFLNKQGQHVNKDTISLSRQESLCVELSPSGTTSSQGSSSVEISDPIPKENPIPKLTKWGDTYRKEVKLMGDFIGNEVVARSPKTSSGEHVNAALAFQTIRDELHDIPDVLENSRTYRFRVETGKDEDGATTFVDNYAMTFGPLNETSTKVVVFDHLDVVPGPKELHTLQETEDHLIGRGTDDMYRTVVSDIYGIVNFYKFLDTLPTKVAQPIKDNFCFVLGFDAAEELGGPYTVDFMKALKERLPNITSNSVCFGEVRGFLQPTATTVDGMQTFISGSIYAEKGGGGITITLQPQKDADGNITPESVQKELEAMRMIRSLQDSFPTVVNETFFRNGLETFSAQKDIRDIMKSFLSEREPNFYFFPSDELDTSHPNKLGIPRDIYHRNFEIFSNITPFDSDFVDAIPDDALLDFFSRQDVLESMGPFFLEHAQKHNPKSTFSKVYNAIIKSVFTCNIMSSNEDGVHTLNATARVLAGHTFKDILRTLEKNLRTIYGDSFNDHVQISSMLFREGSVTEPGDTPLLTTAQAAVEESANIVLEMMHKAAEVPGTTPDVAKHIVKHAPTRVVTRETQLHAGTTAGYVRNDLGIPTLGAGTYSETAESMMHGDIGFHGKKEAIRKTTLAAESVGMFLILLKIAGLPKDYHHKAVAFIYEEIIGDQHATSSTGSIEASPTSNT